MERSRADSVAPQGDQRIEHRGAAGRPHARGQRDECQEPAIDPIVAGSRPFICTSSCELSKILPTPSAPATPMVRPIAVWMMPRRRNSHITCPDAAPSAVRTPISCVRCVTEYAVTA